MDDAARTALIQAIHTTPTMAVVTLTGGGIVAIADLLSVPGASRTLLEATVPYAASALDDLIGGPVAGAVSEATAVAMAEAARQRAVRLVDGDKPVVGVACTAALVSDRPKRGDHRAHVATATAELAECWSLTLAKGTRDRPAEDRVVSDLVIGVLALVCGACSRSSLHPPTPADRLVGPT